MMNSNTRLSANSILQVLNESLDEKRLQQRIDEPLDLAFGSFPLTEIPNESFQSFWDYTANFVLHLYQNTGFNFRISSIEQARMESVELCRYVKPECGNEAIDKLYVDVIVHSSYDMIFVLKQLTKTVKDKQCSLYVDWVFHTYYYHIEWSLKKEVVSLFIKQYQSSLPDFILNLPAGILCDDFPFLIQKYPL